MGIRKETPTGGNWLVYLGNGFLIVLFFAFAFGVWQFSKDIQFQRNAILTDAVIVDVEYNNSSGGSRYTRGGLNAYPSFSFKDQNGNLQVVKPIVGMKGRFQIGEKQSILYNPANPAARVQLEGWVFYKGMGLIIVAVTSPLMFLLVYRYFQSRSVGEKARQKRNKIARDRRARIEQERIDANKDTPRE